MPNFTIAIMVEVIIIKIHESCAKGDIIKWKSNVWCPLIFKTYNPAYSGLRGGKKLMKLALSKVIIRGATTRSALLKKISPTIPVPWKVPLGCG